MKFKYLLNLFLLALTLTSCTTYFIPLDSFRKQFAGMDESKLKPVVVKNPLGHKVAYKTNPISNILCVDKNGNNMVLKNSPALEIRFTNNDNKKTVFYFDLIFVSGDTVTGSRSRLLPDIKSSIPLNQVKTIEIQDGRKKFSYAE